MRIFNCQTEQFSLLSNIMSVRVENRGRPKDSGKREAILSAAVELFMSHGFAGTSMDNLAAAANVSKATLYSHFADKSTLYRAIIEGKVKDYRLQDFSDPPQRRYGMRSGGDCLRYARSRV